MNVSCFFPNAESSHRGSAEDVEKNSFKTLCELGASAVKLSLIAFRRRGGILC
jgi:hypothetical protein